MVFTFDTEEYSLEEFYELFRNQLPKIVSVTQGFYGDIIEDTFDRDQVLRLHTISRQKRVGVTAQIHERRKHFSIPLDYKDIQLCVIDNKGNVGKKKSLAHIVEKAKTFPVTVRFPRDQCITVGNQEIGTNNLPCLIITHLFDEVYFLGNCINYGKMCMEVTHVPLYLSELRITMATGIVGKPDSSWRQYQKMLSQRAALIVYKENYGNPEMAEYYAPDQEETSDETDCYMTPIHYSNFLPRIAITTPSGPAVDVDRKINGRAAPRRCADITKKQRRLPPPLPHRMADDDVSPELENMHNYRPYYKDKPRDLVVPTASTQVMAKSNAPETATEEIPVILKPKDEESVSAKETRKTTHRRQTETNPVTSGNKNMTDKFQSRHDHSSSHVYDNATIKAKGMTQDVPPVVSSPEDVMKLTIDDVSGHLKLLGLEDYVEDFRVQQVDGEVLSAVNGDILKYEFGMKSIEATRLLLFISKGHIPK